MEVPAERQETVEIPLQFDGAGVTAVPLPVVSEGGTRLSSHSVGYKDALCRQITKIVVAAYVVERDRLEIDFEDRTSIPVSHKPEDYVAAEAVIVTDVANSQWGAW